jgi:hypothetical protein
MASAPDTSAMLEEMSACAYRLGVRFAAEAETAQDSKRALEMFHLFDRCFFAVRVAIALQLRLRREARIAEPREPASDDEVLEAAEPVETEDAERPERLDYDRDRDRETERASLPVLLTTLKGVAEGAAALPGPQPAELPTLQDLIARATAEPAPAKPSPLRDRLAGSAAVAVAAAPPRPAPVSPARRATGPPGR